MLALTAGPVKGLAGDKRHMHLVPLSTFLGLYGLRGSQTTLRAVGSWRKDRLHLAILGHEITGRRGQQCGRRSPRAWRRTGRPPTRRLPMCGPAGTGAAGWSSLTIGGQGVGTPG
jgi:hypothetical protein